MLGQELAEAMAPEMMTHRQLAQLMASGQYEWKHEPSNSGTVYTTYKYFEKDGNEPLRPNELGQKIVIRRYGLEDWTEPTLELFKDFERYYSIWAYIDNKIRECNDYAYHMTRRSEYWDEV